MCSKAARLHNKGYKLKSEKKLFHKTVSASLETCSHFNSENMPARSREHDKPLLTSQRFLQLPSHNSWSNCKEAKATCHTYVSLWGRRNSGKQNTCLNDRQPILSAGNQNHHGSGTGLSPQLLSPALVPHQPCQQKPTQTQQVRPPPRTTQTGSADQILLIQWCY